MMNSWLPKDVVLDSMLSENQCEGGWKDIVTDVTDYSTAMKHSFAFIDHVCQHAKWLKVTLELPWRKKMPL